MQRAYWWLAYALFTSAVAGLFAVFVIWDRRDVLHDAQTRLQGHAELIESHARTALSAGDILLQELTREAAGWDFSDPADGRRISEKMRQFVRMLPQATAAWMLDSTGKVLAESWGYPPPQTGTFADRDYIRAHQGREIGLFVGEPALGSSSNRSRFTLSRAVRSPDGALRGVAVVGILNEYFREAYQQLGPQTTAVLSTADGRQLVRGPAAMPAGELLRVERVLPSYGVMVTVEQARSFVLDEWRQRVLWESLVAGLALAAFTSLFVAGLRTAQSDLVSREQLKLFNEQLERRVAERTQELQRSNERQRLATAGARVGTWEMDLLTQQGSWDPQSAELLGVDRQSFDAQDWLEVVHPDDRERAAGAWRQAVAQGTPYEVVFRTAGAVTRWILSRSSVVRETDGTPLRAVGVLVDLTAQKAAEAALQASLAELEALYETAPVGLCKLDRGLRFVRINRRLAEINGRPVAEHLGRTVAEVVPGIMASLEPLFRRVLETRSPVLGHEVKGETPAQPGVERTWSESWVPLLDERGEVAGVNIVVEEITDRRRAERMQQLLVGELSHRVKNILALVQALARRTFREGDASTRTEVFDARLRALAVAHEALVGSNWERAEIGELVASALAPHERSGSARLAVDGPRLWLSAQRAQGLALVLHELATNATKYGAWSNDSGRVSITWSAQNGRCTLEWCETGGPVIASPTRRGFGTTLIETLLSRDSDVHLQYPADGLRCTISFHN